MRQFLLGANGAYPTADTDITAIAAGAVGFGYLATDGKTKIDADGTKITDKGYIVLGRASADGGPVVLPFYKNHFSFVKGEYSAATAYSGDVTVTDVTPFLDYTLIVVKKGVKFNERNRWTATIHAGKSDTATTIAEKLATLITDNASGVTATAAAGKISLSCADKGVDYEVVGADELMGVTVNQTHANIAYGDAAYVTKLANMAAADAGFNDTYQSDVSLLYPNYPLNPLKQADAADTGFTIFTLRFAEPREVKTRDEVVNQIVQVAFPTGSAAITTFETVCEALAE